MPLPLYYISAEEYSKKNESGFDAQRNCFRCSSKPLLSAIEATWLCCPSRFLDNPVANRSLIAIIVDTNLKQSLAIC